MLLSDLKEFLGIKDNSQDNRLNLIISSVTSRLRVLLGGLEVPESLNYILLDVSISRFNRIGSEGLSSHNVEGESLTFSDNDFEPYMNDIQTYLNSRKDAAKGKVRFL